MVLNKLYHEGGHEGGCCHHHDHEEHGHEGCCGHHHDHEEHGHEGCCGHHHDHEEHGHECGCGCAHHHEEPAPMEEEEKLAMLAYMIHHNGQHIRELVDLRRQLPGEAGAFAEEALQALAQSNEKLIQAFQSLRK